jgi:hypothetical protein
MIAGLRERFEAGFGDEPPPPPVGERLAAGRRALRRRRRATLSGGALVLAMVAFSPLLFRASDGGSGGGIDPPTPGPIAPDVPTPVHLLVAPPGFVRADTPPVLYLYGRMFKRSHDVAVLATYGEIDVSGSRPQGAAIVRDHGRTTWIALAGNEPDRILARRDAPYDYQLFMAWAQHELPILSRRLALAATGTGVRGLGEDPRRPG